MQCKCKRLDEARLDQAGDRQPSVYGRWRGGSLIIADQLQEGSALGSNQSGGLWQKRIAKKRAFGRRPDNARSLECSRGSCLVRGKARLGSHMANDKAKIER